MDTESSLMNQGAGKRNRDDSATPSTLIAPAPASIIRSSCCIEDGTVEGGRIYFKPDFTKRLISDVLCFPSGHRSALR